MAPVILDKLDELRTLCRRFDVVRLEAFGSVLRADFDAARSDVDLLVEFAPMSPGTHARAYFSLLESLQDLFGRKVDLIETRAIRNPYLLEAINRQRVELYAP